MSHFRLASPRAITLFGLELGLIFGVLYGLAVLTQTISPAATATQGVTPHVLLATSLFGVCLFGARRTWLGDNTSLRREFALISVICAAFGVVAFLASLYYFGSIPLRAALFLEGAFAVPAAIMVWRWAGAHWDLMPADRERLVVLGEGPMARELATWLAEDQSGHFEITGFASEEPARVGEVVATGIRVTTDYASLPAVAERHADRVIVALEEKRGRLPMEALMELRLRGVQVEEASTFIERTSGRVAVDNVLPSWLVFSDGFRTSPLRAFVKRTIDIVLSGAMLVATSPVILLTALAVRLDSPGPALFRQARVGRNGREFNLMKFRSMIVDAEAKSGPTWCTEDDPRITRVGRFIRKFRIDELPQLINVLRGHMSFVGPRPERRHFVEDLEQRIRYFGLRMAVRPGLTGWAQVQYPYGASIEDAKEKLKYDLYYIKNGDVLFDLWIVLKTFRVVLLGSGAR